MSAPYSIGRKSTGVATVLSTINGNPREWASRASFSMSQTFPAGLPIDSQITARVLSSIKGSMSSARSLAAKRASTPCRRSVWVRRAIELRRGHDAAAPIRERQKGVGERGLT